MVYYGIIDNQISDRIGKGLDFDRLTLLSVKFKTNPLPLSKLFNNLNQSKRERIKMTKKDYIKFADLCKRVKSQIDEATILTDNEKRIAEQTYSKFYYGIITILENDNYRFDPVKFDKAVFNKAV